MQGAEHVKTPLHLEVSRASAAAIAAVEQAGGSVTCAHFNRCVFLDCCLVLGGGWFD